MKECYHCRQTIPERELKTHDCWTTTEENLIHDLPEDLKDAWERIRETAADFGDQRIYASHKSIMFSRKNCYFFVRPKKNVLEVCFFLGRTVKNPAIRMSQASSRVKVGHLIHVKHRDEVEAPITDWLREAYEVSETLRTAPRSHVKSKTKSRPKPKTKAKPKRK
jgi:hypothetical protein